MGQPSKVRRLLLIASFLAIVAVARCYSKAAIVAKQIDPRRNTELAQSIPRGIEVHGDTLSYVIGQKVEKKRLLDYIALLLNGKEPWLDSVYYRVTVTRSGISTVEVAPTELVTQEKPVLTSSYVEGSLRAQTWNGSFLAEELHTALDSNASINMRDNVADRIQRLTPVSVELGDGGSSYQVVLWYEILPDPGAPAAVEDPGPAPALSISNKGSRAELVIPTLRARIAPNPTSSTSKLFLDMSRGTANVRVYSVTGVPLVGSNVDVREEGTSSLDLDGTRLASGIYSVVVTGSEGQQRMLRWAVVH